MDNRTIYRECVAALWEGEAVKSGEYAVKRNDDCKQQKPKKCGAPSLHDFPSVAAGNAICYDADRNEKDDNACPNKVLDIFHVRLFFCVEDGRHVCGVLEIVNELVRGRDGCFVVRIVF